MLSIIDIGHKCEVYVEIEKNKLKCEQIWRLFYGGKWLVSFIEGLYFKCVVLLRQSDGGEWLLMDQSLLAVHIWRLKIKTADMGATYKSLLWHITYNVILTYNIDIEKWLCSSHFINNGG